MNFLKPCENAYRWFFPIGAVAGILGVSLWILFQQGFLSFYPREAHANIMFFAMLWSFVAGFLMTAVPKMTKSFPANFLEISVGGLLVAMQLSASITNHLKLSIAVWVAQCVFLLIFIVRRFLVFRQIPFPGFAFLPMAFIQSLLGAGFYLFSDQSSREYVTLLCGEAFVMNLIIGIGSRLIPALTRLPNATLPTEGSVRTHWRSYIGVLLIVNISYWIQLIFDHDLGVSLRLLGVGYALFFFMGLLRVPQFWTMTGIGLKLALLCILTGQIMALIGGINQLATLHVIFIGGLSTITFLISTRVILAHGGQDLSYEIRSWRIALIVGLLLASALLRWLGFGQVTGPMMMTSAVIFSIAVLLWLDKFRRISFEKPDSDGC